MSQPNLEVGLEAQPSQVQGNGRRRPRTPKTLKKDTQRCNGVKAKVEPKSNQEDEKPS